MRKLLLFVCAFALLGATEIQLKDIKQLENNNVKVIVVNKNDLSNVLQKHKYIKRKNNIYPKFDKIKSITKSKYHKIAYKSKVKIKIKKIKISNRQMALNKLQMYLKKPYSIKNKKQFLYNIAFLLNNVKNLDINFIKSMSLNKENVKELINTIKSI